MITLSVRHQRKARACWLDNDFEDSAERCPALPSAWRCLWSREVSQLLKQARLSFMDIGLAEQYWKHISETIEDTLSLGTPSHLNQMTEKVENTRFSNAAVPSTGIRMLQMHWRIKLEE